MLLYRLTIIIYTLLNIVKLDFYLFLNIYYSLSLNNCTMENLKEFYTLSELSDLIDRTSHTIRRYNKEWYITGEYQKWKYWKELIFSKEEVERLLKNKNISIKNSNPIWENNSKEIQLKEEIIKEKDSQILKLQWVINQVQNDKDNLLNEKDWLINEKIKLLENWKEKDKEKENLKSSIVNRNYVLLFLILTIIFLILISTNILKIN